MSEIISIDLNPVLAERVSLMHLTERLMLAGAGGEVTYVRKDDRITISCTTTTALELIRLLRDCIDEDFDRDHVMACGVVMNKLNAAIDACLSRPATQDEARRKGSIPGL